MGGVSLIYRTNVMTPGNVLSLSPYRSKNSITMNIFTGLIWLPIKRTQSCGIWGIELSVVFMTSVFGSREFLTIFFSVVL